MPGNPPYAAAETRTEIDCIQCFVDTVQKLSLAKDIGSVMTIVRTVARKLTGADGATFVLRENDNCYYADEDAISPLWKGNRFPMKTCISGWVMLNKQAAVIENIYEDDRIPAEAYRPTFVKSLAMVPIRTLDPIGAIGNYWANQHLPTPEELSMLQALADITAVSIENILIRDSLERRVNERTRELEHSLEREKLLSESKNTFLSMASHEFRTPLSTIFSSAALIEKYTSAEQHDKRQKHVKRIKSSVKNLTFVLNDFLSLDKLEQGLVTPVPEPVNLEMFMTEIVDELNELRKEGQAILFTYSGDTSVVLDRQLLRNVMLNLLSNAIKYSETDIYLDADVTGSVIRIHVRDKGIGIPEEQQKKMFGKYFRASNATSVQGTGLGLNIVKRYITLLNGTIDFTSAEGQGTTFTVQLPR